MPSRFPIAVLALILAAGSLSVPAQARVHDPARYVNPYLGTKPGAPDQGTGGGAGNNFPGADVPFGMVQWSPDTVTEQHGGYFYDDNRIKGFSLTHLSGAGCDTYQDIPFLPISGEVTESPAVHPDRYVARFSHRNETVRPGYYGVRLDNGVHTELSVTRRSGAARFAFPQGKPATLLVNTSGSVTGTRDSRISIGRDSISGWAASGDFCGTKNRYRVYFHAQFDKPFQRTGTWRGGTVTPRRSGVQDSGGYAEFEPGSTVNVRLGLSFVSAEGAKRNLAAENRGRDVDAIASQANAAWNRRLGEIAVTGGTEEQKRTFYSSLYHAYLQPNVFSDVDGRYPGFDGKIHTAPKGRTIYTDFSGWDIYRSEVPLLSVLAPKEMSDIAYTMREFAGQGGAWDRWTVANDYTGVMNGDPEHIILASAYAFGAKDFGAHRALLSMLRGANQPTSGYEERPGLGEYLKLGYVPGKAADTLEYTSADFAIAQLAHRLGDDDTYRGFMKRARYWHKLYNPETGYLQPRNADGGFPADFDPASPDGWVEGNGAQYAWMVPYDYAGLIRAYGGRKAVNNRLDAFFARLNAGTRKPYAFLSNEPGAASPWVYDFTGAPAKTQQLTRRVLRELFRSGPDGLAGNDDLGQMGAWYVWTAMGLYPEYPGRAELVTGSPVFTGVAIHSPDGREFRITAPDSSETNQYVTGLGVNGRDSTRPWLPESFAERGGSLEFAMAPRPTDWGTANADAPPSP